MKVLTITFIDKDFVQGISWKFKKKKMKKITKKEWQDHMITALDVLRKANPNVKTYIGDMTVLTFPRIVRFDSSSTTLIRRLVNLDPSLISFLRSL